MLVYAWPKKLVMWSKEISSVKILTLIDLGPHGRAAGRQGRSACKTSHPARIRVSFTHLARCVNGDAYNMRTVLRLQQNVFTHLDSTQTATKCDSGYDSLIRFLICHIDMPYWYAPYWKDISTTSLTSGSLHRLVIFSAFPRPPWHQVYYIDLWFFNISTTSLTSGLLHRLVIFSFVIAILFFFNNSTTS